MRLRRLTTLLALTAAVTLAACGGGGGEPTSPTATPSEPTQAATEPAGDASSTPSPTSPPTPTDDPVAEMAVEVQPFEGGVEDLDAAAIHEAYSAFETALWESLAAGEITDELRDLAGPDVITGMEQTIADQPQPLGGTVTVTVTATVEDVVVMAMGGGPFVSEADLTGCSDQTQVEYESGNGSASGFTASIVFEEGFVVQEYILGTEAC